MKKQYLTYSVLAVLLLVALLTNPPQERHKEVIKTKVNAHLQKSLKEAEIDTENPFAQAGQSIGMLLGSTMVNGIIDNSISTDNYLIFSITKVTIDGKSKVIGMGAFGNVFLSNKLEEALNGGKFKKIIE